MFPVKNACYKFAKKNLYLLSIHEKNVTLTSKKYFFSIKNGRDLSSIAEDGLTLMKILDAIYESASTKKEVVID